MIRFLLLCIFACTTCYARPSVKESLEQIPLHDRKKIERLFLYLVYNEPFGYTLFGDKPFSTTGWPKEFRWELLFIGCYETCLKYDWSIWEKYKHLFPIKKFAFLAIEDPTYLEINLFNLAECKKKISENLDLFQKKLKCSDSPDKILDYLKLCSDSLGVLGGSQALYGLLLGFGRNNSLYFEHFYTDKMYFLKPLNMFNPETCISPFKMRLPDFASLDDEDTERLRKNYTEQRSRMIELYSQGDFLEITLCQLTSN